MKIIHQPLKKLPIFCYFIQNKIIKYIILSKVA